MAAASSIGGGTGTAAIWARLGRPYDAVDVVDALFGLSTSAARQLVGTVLATCPEAHALLDRMPHVVRSLAVSTTSRPERYHGEVRGPVLWSETIAARASSAGDTAIFVCSSPTKAFDTDQNRVLVAALEVVRRAAHAVDNMGPHAYDDPVLRDARANGTRAIRFLEHRTLAAVPRVQPHGRTLRRARMGTRRQTYRPAAAMLERAVEPLTLAHVIPYLDQRTAAQHDLLAAIAAGLEADGWTQPSFRVEDGALRSGGLRYIHPRRLGTRDRDRQRDPLHGVFVGDLLLDVPERVPDTNPFRAQAELASRATGRRAFVVMDGRDIPRAVELAVRSARRSSQ